MQRDLKPGQWEACNSPSDGTRFRHSHPEHTGISDGN